MKYLSYIFFPVLMIGMLAAAFLLPKIVNPNPSNLVAKVEYVRPGEGLEMLPEYVAPKVDKSKAKVVATENPVQAVDNRDYNEELAFFFSKLKTGDLVGAEKEMELLKEQLPAGVFKGLQVSLDSAKNFEKSFSIAKAEAINAEAAKQRLEKLARENTTRQLVMAKASSGNDQVEAELAATIEKTNRLESDQMAIAEKFDQLHAEHLKKIESSIKELSQVTEAVSAAARIASESAREVAKLQTDLRTRNSRAFTSVTGDEEGAIPLVLPEDSEIRFKTNSSILPTSSVKALERIAIFLKHDSRMGIILRAYGDPSQVEDFNDVITNARSQQIMAELASKGVGRKQIKIEKPDQNRSPKDANRLEMVFVEL